MKIYLRILRYAPNLVPRLIKFLITSVLGIIFSVANIALVIPMMNTLFGYQEKKPVGTPVLPEFSLSVDYIVDTFNYYFVKIIQEHGANDAMLFICVAIIASVLLTNLFRYMERMTASRIRVDVVKNMRMHFSENVTKLHIGFFNSNRKGDLISRFTNDMLEVESAVVNSLKFVMKEPITIIVYFAVLFFISVKLTLFTLILLPITGGILAEIIKRLKKKAVQSQESVGRMVNVLDETFAGMRVVKAFNARRFILNKVDQETTYHRKVNISIARKNELAGPVSETLGIFIVAGIILYGSTLVLGENPSLSPGEFLGFLGLFAQIIQPAKNFSNGVTSVQKGTVSAERIFSIIDTVPVIESKPGALELQKFSQNIEFRNVSFAYETENVLRNINLVIEKGKTIALVGPSGGGKSTLADLVPRFYDPTQGEVLIDGVSIREYEIESLRKQMGVVTQESILFN
ncbi:MAG TPA: ABC transporter ATP-binding protein, partial [Chryseosolibacter sp.]